MPLLMCEGGGTVSLRPRVWPRVWCREERAELVVEFLELVNRFLQREAVVSKLLHRA